MRSPSSASRTSVPKLKKKLDIWFSRYIRWRDKDRGCFTCGKVGHHSEFHAGHFISRKVLATRYDEQNVHLQCCSCNLYYGGQVEAYANRLEIDYGPGTIAMLDAKARKIVKDLPFEEMIEKYKAMALEVGWEA
jgi:hypothetical protein